MYSHETTTRLDYLRQQSLQRDLTTEEAAEVIRLIRQDRVTAAAVSKASKAKKETPDPSAVLAKLKGLMGGGTV